MKVFSKKYGVNGESWLWSWHKVEDRQTAKNGRVPGVTRVELQEQLLVSSSLKDGYGHSAVYCCQKDWVIGRGESNY